MPTITIDGRPCDYEGNKNILQVALDSGIEIPHYCYHEGLSVAASCRICLAEVSAPNPRNDNKPELIPKLVPTCQTPAADGMEVFTQSPKAVANQKAVMEYLLINHPLDCPVCDQAGECLLQDYSFKYGNGQSRFEENKIKQPKKDMGPTILLYSDRCIMCSRCVRFTQEVTGTHEIGIFGRGSSEQIDIFPGKPLDNELAGNVVDICPVGAFLDKDFLMSMRVWNLTSTPGIDGITASGDNLMLEHHDGRLYRVKPRTNLDVNQWWTSDEIRYGWKFVHREDRLTTPSLKPESGSELEPRRPVDWNQGLQAAADGLRASADRFGAGSLALVVSPMLTCEDAYELAQLALAVDPQANLAVGPVPFDGEDKSFPGGYTVYAEKAPNARGVRRALELAGGRALSFDQLLSKSGELSSVILTGNYPSDWAGLEVLSLLDGKFSVLLDTLPGAAGEKADVLLPAVTWTEKAGTFENVQDRLQSFGQAIPAIEFARAEAQIAIDLGHLVAGRERRVFNAATTRDTMSDVFKADVHHPPQPAPAASDVQYVAL